ncbi:MAG: FG-GAP-like repeat-containing protein [Acidobacteriota bacterium]|nr:FG-GAP-like repeat-containing protein [Acidobacteriota bacterium]
MKKRLALISFIIFALFSFAYRQTTMSKRFDSSNKQTQRISEIKPQSVKAVAFGLSEKVSSFAPASPEKGSTSKKMGRAEEQARAVPNKEPFRKQVAGATHDSDSARANFSDAPMPTPSLSFDGLSNNDNAAAYGFRAVPPDTNGDVGPNHYVQSVNILTRVFDKSGNALTPPFKLSSIFSVLGTTCSQRNDGDPIVLYDALADRWMLSQFCSNFPPFRQLIAVSQTSDPAGAYFVYEFVMPNVKFNDYPKLGVWTDGYYLSADEFLGSEYAGSGVFAFDKKKMLAGDRSASYIYFDLASPTTVRFGGLLPSDLDGLNAPPPNAPNTFVGYMATEYGDANDALRLFDFHADFTNPQNSTFTERTESPLTVAPFDPTSPDGRADIVEPPPGEPLDSQSDRLMYRSAYRNFGTHESLVVNQTVRVAPVGQTYRGGVRVYELRKSDGIFSVQEQATVGTNDASRWMGSAAQDYQGNLAVEYSFTSETKKPSIVYSGKLASEPVGTFRAEENLIVGTGVQTGFGSRWGDYSAINVDPTDDCTFWLTNQYYTQASQTESPYGWLTRIGKFKFAECAAAPRATINGVVLNALNNQPIANAIVTANAVYTRNTNAVGSYGNLTLVPNTYVLTVSANGFRTQTVTVTIVDGQILTQNFALEPTAILSANGYQITAESCAVNNAIDPSETVTINVALRNTGARNTTNLTATLLGTGGVINAGAAQNFGALMAGGTSVSRSFTFTASPNLRCGDALTLTLQLNDGSENLGTVTINLNIGAPRTAFQENFDSVTEPNLPNGWTTSASGAQQIWKTSDDAFQTPPNSAYSFAAGQIGVNELVSPAFRVNSPNAELTFRNRYDLETTFLRNKRYDGAVLEIKIGTLGRFQDILAAGGAFEAGGYDGVLESCCQNPLSGRPAWSGKSGPNQTPEFITSKVKLPALAAGKNVQLRWRVGTDNGTSREGQFIDNIFVSDGFVCACQNAQLSRAPFDFDGDGKTDLSIFRPSLSPETPDFYIQNSSNNSSANVAWGSVGDVPVNADYDGDGKTDYAVFRSSTGTWFILRSSDNTIFPVNFGLAGDELVPADYDGDGRSDIAVFRQSNSTWYILQSSDNQNRSVRFGASGDLPVPADYDGDGKTDVAVYRPSNGAWYVQKSSDGGSTSVQFGQSGDKPVVGDYDGDGKADFVVFRPSSGVWYLLKSSDGFSVVRFGLQNDQPLQVDFDGDGKRDVAVYRQSTGFWYYLKSSDGRFAFRQFGISGDVPLPSIFVP